VDVFLERVAPLPRVLLFGAGHVGEAVARALAPLAFRVSVFRRAPGVRDARTVPRCA